MKIIGLTGGIASGKSTVASLFRERGAVIIDADIVARDALVPHTATWSKVVRFFGEKILKDDNAVDRKKLGNIVFSDKDKLSMLNSITHPDIVEEINRQVKQHRKRAECEVLVIDAALLLEVGLEVLVDEVWLVTVDRDVQIKRLMARDKELTLPEALDRIKAQTPQEERIKHAHIIIDNSGTIQMTEDQFKELWKDYGPS